MPTLTDDAICIRRWDFSETSQTVSLFTRGHGIIRGLAKGSKREKGAFSGGIELLSRGQIVAILKTGRDLATLTAWDLQQVHWALRQSLRAHRVGLYMADLVHRMMTDHDPHPYAFDALDAALHATATPEATDAALLRFHWVLLTECGYQPQLDIDVVTDQPLPDDGPTLAFAPQAGGVTADTGAGDRWRVRRDTVVLLRRLANGEDIADAEPITVQRANLLMATYIREVLGKEPPTARGVFPEMP